MASLKKNKIIISSRLMNAFKPLAKKGTHREDGGWPKNFYAASKLGVNAFSHALQARLDRERPAGDDVVVNSVTPGHVSQGKRWQKHCRHIELYFVNAVLCPIPFFKDPGAGGGVHRARCASARRH